jgi:predicted ester cyclase
MNTNKLDDALKLVADDFKLVDYTEEKDVAGKKAFKDMLHTWMTAFPDMKVKSTASFTDGDFVVEEFEYTGVQKGALGPIKATNKPVNIHQLEIDELKDGKFVKAWSFGNGNEMLGQLGVLSDKKEQKKEEKKKK